MKMFKLVKSIKLYKPQFDSFNLTRTGGYELDRISLELDSLLFRIKYMNKKGYKDYDKYKSEFTEKAMYLRKLFGMFMYDFLIEVITIPKDYHLEDIYDVLAKDVKINTNYVTFTMILFSKNKSYLEFVDSSIIDGEYFNMFPNEYFRFQTDSYNDAIAKAFPELFDIKHQNIIGTGNDADVFVHNLTFQTSERCSLNCSYCMAGDTPILMEDLYYKNIKDIKVGDKVIGCNEFSSVDNKNKFFPSKVTKLFHHKEKVYTIELKSFMAAPDRIIKITGNHPIMLIDGTFKCVKDINDTKDIIQMTTRFMYDNRDSLWDIKPTISPIKLLPRDYDIYFDDETEIDVYNIETECHTYIANNIVVHNCYQFNKTPMRMEFDTAKKFIDHLLNDDYGYINRYNSPAIILEFIGGEPLLEIKLTRQIYEYFLDKCYELNHPWFTMHRISICSNGLQYFDEDVQEFFKDYSSNISFNISIDGNKQLHDSCRIQPNGEGSYDIAMTALNHFNTHYTSERNSKMTLAPSNINYLFESVKDFIDNGMKCINLNCVFEEGWNKKTANIEYYQLKQLADYIIDNNLENIYIALFNERQEDMHDKDYDGTFCGGAGSMTAIRPNGQIYPCIRYMPTSVGDDVPDLCMGSVDDGWNERSDGSEVIKLLDSITRRSSSNDICYECPISNNCPGCIALGHAIYGTPNIRTTFHCIQHIAETLANVYYWNKLLLKHPDWNMKYRKNVVPDEWSLLIIDEKELTMLKKLEHLAKQK